MRNDVVLLVNQLRVTASMIELGEKIQWGIDFELMNRAADKLQQLGEIIENDKTELAAEK